MCSCEIVKEIKKIISLSAILESKKFKMENNIVEQESDLPFTQLDGEVVSMVENITVAEKKTIAVSSAEKVLLLYSSIIIILSTAASTKTEL